MKLWRKLLEPRWIRRLRSRRCGKKPKRGKSIGRKAKAVEARRCSRSRLPPSYVLRISVKLKHNGQLFVLLEQGGSNV